MDNTYDGKSINIPLNTGISESDYVKMIWEYEID